ncbi:nucleoside hydrolase [Methylobrevis pamukkalensis]|uniref:Pyrimidine-specific ribonucleoside hydrolase RihA n=1 Tax=Methylobrevis pamukkalensis TaxID=1439726 RepID=A0A1E3H2M2_9HYPH|nr:nucleoside hydrolase [Methylobrevis pamukkalensis]ODN69791.1 Pyrimidine-specific ribonucleoside hydrolase RihA [Methylobrevis pamukkalensis]
MPPISVIIDTDPGQDDAVAIALAVASPDDFEILGLTIVAGNVPLALTVDNGRKVLELCGRPDIPVYAGADRPLLEALVTAEHVHGETGLNGIDLPEPTVPVAAGHAVDFIIETVMSRPEGTVTLCALGPLTNIAIALAREPRIAARIPRIVLMGGAMSEGGNITPAAEFNIYVDPQAAALVFAAGIPLVVLPLDVTHKAATTPARIERFRALPNRCGPAFAGLLDFAKRFDEEKYGTTGGPLHDPMTVAWMLRPEIFSGREVNIAIETASPLTRGMTVVDWWKVTDRPVNALFIRDLDDDAFYDLLVERFAALP